MKIERIGKKPILSYCCLAATAWNRNDTVMGENNRALSGASLGYDSIA